MPNPFNSASSSKLSGYRRSDRGPGRAPAQGPSRVPSIWQHSRHWWISRLAAAGLIAALVLAGLTVVSLQRRANIPQDPRQQAFVPDGEVVLSSLPSGNTRVPVDTKNDIVFRINTQGSRVQQVQLVFNLVTATLDEAPELRLLDELRFRTTRQEVELTDDGYLVMFTAEIIDPDLALVSDGPHPMLEVSLQPVKPGRIEFDFDGQHSLARLLGSNQDQLRRLPDFVFMVVDPNDAAAVTETITDTTISDSQGRTATSRSVEITRFEQDDGQSTGTATSSPTADPPTSCNQGCSSNAECAPNLRCYNNRCRLVTNVSSQQCQPAGRAGPGASQSKGGQASPTPSSTAACRQSCASNTDCSANFRCFQSECRLAANPSSLSCSPAESKTVSPLFSATPSAALVASPAASASPSATATSAGQTRPVPVSGLAAPDSARPEPPGQTTTDALLGRLNQILSAPAIIGAIAVAVGAGALFVVFKRLSLLARKVVHRGGDGDGNGDQIGSQQNIDRQSSSRSSDQKSSGRLTAAQTEQELQAKIAELALPESRLIAGPPPQDQHHRQLRQEPASLSPAPLSVPSMPSAPPPLPSPPSPIPPSPTLSPKTPPLPRKQSPSPGTPSSPTPVPNSSMVNRLKYKGIEIPLPKVSTSKTSK
ncbi:MAG: hypothetical protein COU69_04145 [Candidatus Pacebacteria bacterium CG10_big_fil_rev_8_21_14_0_10_56_10]|nr:MAG: hypothetical protein COU69_04145 [Candidatus Pacebacteria bacterium CG10_big_fil_rev_8_21_14_0_10_56_10]